MKVSRILACGIFVFAALVNVRGQNTNTNLTTVIGQWDFNSSNLGTATVGAPLQFLGALPVTYITNQTINGRPAGIMQFPAANPQQGILATFAPAANGGGTNLNQYTILMDIMWPSESDFAWRAIFNANTNNQDDAEIFVNPDNQVGIYNDYALNLPALQWHRLVLVYDLTNPTNHVTRYLDGDITNAAPQQLEESGIDSRFSLHGGLLFFSDNDDETATGFVNSIQLRSGAMSPSEIAALGGASSGGLGQGPDPVGEIRITNIQRNGQNIVISLSEPRNAQLQKKVRIDDAAWQPLETASTGTFTVPINEPTSFFRVELR
jgi:hypothetical protein